MTKHCRPACVALTLICGAWLSGLAHADDAAMEPVWTRYWMAIAAANQCEDRKFTGPEYDAMTHVINKKVNYQLGAGPRTHLIDVAKSYVWDRVFKYGCQDSQISGLLALYHNQLEPVLR